MVVCSRGGDNDSNGLFDRTQALVRIGFILELEPNQAGRIPGSTRNSVLHELELGLE